MIGMRLFTWYWLRHLLWMIPSVLIGVPLLYLMLYAYSFNVHDWTVYSFHFREEAFQTIEPGDSIDTLVSKVGSPLRMNYFDPQAWHYDGFRIYFDAKNRAYEKYNVVQSEYIPLLSKEEVLRQFGEPHNVTWQYDGYSVAFNRNGKAVCQDIQHPDGTESMQMLDYFDMDTVRRIYGEPLSVSLPSHTYRQVWEYTQPGRLGRWASVTWYSRSVMVDLREYQVVDVRAQYMRGGNRKDHPLNMQKPPVEQDE